MDLSEILNSKYHGIPVDRMIGTAFLLVLSAFVIFYLVHVVRRMLLAHRSRLRMSYETVIFLMRIVRIALLIGALFLLLNMWGVGISGLWTTLMSLAAVIGVGFLAVWTMVSNVTAKLFLTVWRPFHIGTTVEILPEKLAGKVVDINMMFTVMRDDAGGALYVPNNLFFQKIFRVSGKGSASSFFDPIDGLDEVESPQLTGPDHDR